MAEKKYDLLLYSKRDSNAKIRNQPWYKERLATKYKDLAPKLNAAEWTFIKDGLDDFRDGKPPVIDESILLKNKKGPRPMILGTDSFEQVPNQRIKKKVNKEAAIYSKKVASAQKRVQKVEKIEQNLLGHPLALYPHLEDSLAPDLFEEIVDLIDPTLALDDEDIDAIVEQYNEQELDVPLVDEHLRVPQIEQKERERELDTASQCSVGYHKLMRNENKHQYKWLHQTAEEISREERNKANKKRIETPQDTKIDEVTKEFCDWVRDLGGDSNNIEESTVNSLFASGYETKPTLSVPVRVVELTNVPPELRAEGRTPTPTQDESQYQDKNYTPSWVKVKYGAWYLKPETWKVLPADQPLLDPKELEGKQMSEPKKKSKDLDKVLTSHHGAKAFKSFIENKGTRIPEFLEGVSGQVEDTIIPEVVVDSLGKRKTKRSAEKAN